MVCCQVLRQAVLLSVTRAAITSHHLQVPGHPVSSSAVQVTVFDPDLDPDGSHARLLTDILSTGLTPLSRDRR